MSWSLSLNAIYLFQMGKLVVIYQILLLTSHSNCSCQLYGSARTLYACCIASPSLPLRKSISISLFAMDECRINTHTACQPFYDTSLIFQRSYFSMYAFAVQYFRVGNQRIPYVACVLCMPLSCKYFSARSLHSRSLSSRLCANIQMDFKCNACVSVYGIRNRMVFRCEIFSI